MDHRCNVAFILRCYRQQSLHQFHRRRTAVDVVQQVGNTVDKTDVGFVGLDGQCQHFYTFFWRMSANVEHKELLVGHLIRQVDVTLAEALIGNVRFVDLLAIDVHRSVVLHVEPVARFANHALDENLVVVVKPTMSPVS